MSKAQKYKDKVKVVFDKRANQQTFQENDLVLHWDIRREDRGKHGKFDNLWFGPLRIALLLKHLDDDQQASGPINGHYLKKFFVE